MKRLSRVLSLLVVGEVSGVAGSRDLRLSSKPTISRISSIFWFQSG
ncbi:unnamed protein product [Arabidopsis halleri]